MLFFYTLLIKKCFFKDLKKKSEIFNLPETANDILDNSLNFCFESDCLSMPWQWEHLATRCETLSYSLSLSLHDTLCKLICTCTLFLSDKLSKTFLSFFDFQLPFNACVSSKDFSQMSCFIFVSMPSLFWSKMTIPIE